MEGVKSMRDEFMSELAQYLLNKIDKEMMELDIPDAFIKAFECEEG